MPSPRVLALLSELYPPRLPRRHRLGAGLRAAALICPAVRRMGPEAAVTGDMQNPVRLGVVIEIFGPVYADRPGQTTLPLVVWADDLVTMCDCEVTQ